jgi:hypothetical protein
VHKYSWSNSPEGTPLGPRQNAISTSTAEAGGADAQLAPGPAFPLLWFGAFSWMRQCAQKGVSQDMGPTTRSLVLDSIIGVEEQGSPPGPGAGGLACDADGANVATAAITTDINNDVRMRPPPDAGAPPAAERSDASTETQSRPGVCR